MGEQDTRDSPHDDREEDRGLPLFRRIPELERRIPRMPLGNFPTAIEPLDVTTRSGASRTVWVKRDDLTSRVYGGNKVRKLEFLLAEARRRGTGRLITGGALGSHHGLATAVFGTRVGLPVTLVLYPQPPSDHVRAVLDSARAAGAEIRRVGRMELVPVGLIRERFRHRAERPFLVAPGGSDALGTLGYVNAGLELLEQVEEGRAPRPDVVHVACGTMGTAAGLALAFALAGAPIRIRAVRVTPRILTNELTLRRLIRSAARRLHSLRGVGRGEAVALAAAVLERISLRHDHFGDGYGRATAAGRRATERFASAGLRLDSTYTSKAAAGLLQEIEANEEVVHLYWHTLGETRAADHEHRGGAASEPTSAEAS
jgi:1-aminocyclopropane-1-carboxylate deaminase/D-cysteine desulfhydrase-like pyridoxal-dependent ACC family enzyme